MHESDKRQDLMVPGLHKSCEYVHDILRQEIEVVGKENVVLWGLSQGCATSLMSLLTWDGVAFAGVVGMCGYLPFANQIKEMSDEPEDVGDDFFARSDDESEDDVFGREKTSEANLPLEAVRFLRERIDMEGKEGMVFRDVPVFLGHGIKDEKVDIKFGREAGSCLSFLGLRFRWLSMRVWVIGIWRKCWLILSSFSKRNLVLRTWNSSCW